MHSYAAAVGTFWTLEDTLIGFLFNDLHWCGQHKNPGVFFYSHFQDIPQRFVFVF